MGQVSIRLLVFLKSPCQANALRACFRFRSHFSAEVDEQISQNLLHPS